MHDPLKMVNPFVHLKHVILEQFKQYLEQGRHVLF